MPREKFREKPFYYKLLSTMLRIASGMFILLALFFAIKFLVEIPLYRMFDGISTGQILMMVLVIIAVICFFVAWKNAFAGGIATLFPIVAYTVIESLENKVYTAGAINYIMLGIAIMFIIQGIIKKHIEYDKMEEIMGPRIVKDDGPNLMDLHL